MIVVLYNEPDIVAQQVLSELVSSTGVDEVMAVPAELLTVGARWHYRSYGGRSDSSVRLRDGRHIGSSRVRAVFNRLRWAPAPWFESQKDREYATMEIFALTLSWLHSLPCPVVNPPSPRGLGGADRSPLEWLGLGVKAKMATRQLRLATNGRRFHRPGHPWHPAPVTRFWQVDNGGMTIPPGSRPVLLAEPVEAPLRVLVAGRRVFGAPTAEWESAARKLSALAKSPLIELSIGWSCERDIRVLCGATARPEQLTAPEAAAIAEMLVRSEVRR